MNASGSAFAIIALVAVAGPLAAMSGKDRLHDGVRMQVLVNHDRLPALDQVEGSDDPIPDQPDRLHGSVATGYDITAAPQMTIGPEIGVGTALSGGIDTALARDRLCIETDRDVYIRARVRFAVTRYLIVSGFAGYAHSRLRATLSEWEGDGFTTRTVTDGAGDLRLTFAVAQRLSRRFSVKGGYRWTSYGDDTGYQGSPARRQLPACVGIAL